MRRWSQLRTTLVNRPDHRPSITPASSPNPHACSLYTQHPHLHSTPYVDGLPYHQACKCCSLCLEHSSSPPSSLYQKRPLLTTRYKANPSLHS